MYHPGRSWNTRLLLAAVAALALSGKNVMPANADASRLTTAQNLEGKNLGIVSDTFDLLPAGKRLKKEPEDVTIYEFDKTPLGHRRPLLFVHGLRGEFYPHFRWLKVAESFKNNSEFDRRYKIYFVRYPTTITLDNVTPKFGKQIDRLYTACKNRPITMVALSMGGNLTYETMLDPAIESKVRGVLALGSPFHGSPLFCEDWMQYSIYKRLSMPWTRIDHSLALRLYFDRNKNLLSDFRWDDYDGAIPEGGKFKSRLPLGPRGILTYDRTINTRLQKLNDEKNEKVKSKFITYGGYLHNPYLDTQEKRFVENAALYPLTFITYKLPAHMAREHPVLKMLNRDIAAVEVRNELKAKGQSPFHYALNDGITPVSSALFLPNDVIGKVALTNNEDVAKLKGKTDVKTARVFKNIDHLTYIDGWRPFNESSKIKDELNPDEGDKDIFSWMLSDILKFDQTSERVADDEPVIEEERSAPKQNDETKDATDKKVQDGQSHNFLSDSATSQHLSYDEAMKDIAPNCAHLIDNANR